MNTRIDRTRYFVLPKPRVARQLAFAQLLRKRKPAEGSPELDKASAQLDGAIAKLEQARVARHRELNPESSPSEDRELDAFVDGLWAALVEALERQQVFLRPAALRLAQAAEDPGTDAPKIEAEPEAKASFDYAAEIAKAEAAERIHRRLFGAERLAFTQLKYVEQASHTATLWAIIEEDGLEAELAAICGPSLLAALADSHQHYLAMSEDRQLRLAGSKVNLSELQTELQHSLQHYVIALLALIDDEDAAQVEAIRAALRPIDALRERLERERTRAGAGALLELEGEGDEGDGEDSAGDPETGQDPSDPEQLAALEAEIEALIASEESL